MLEVKKICKSFGNHSVLTNVSFNIKKGEIVGLVGKNGAGKTTLMKCILGLMHFEEGEILFEGNSDYIHSKELMNKIGFLLDCKMFEDLNSFDNLKIQEMYINSSWDKDKIINILNFMDLPTNKKKVKNYSFGMKQRLGLGVSILNNPTLLIVDEPFVGLDPIGTKNLKNYLMMISKEKGVSILLSSHQLSEIEDMCDRFLFIENTSLREHNKNEKKVIRLVLDCNIDKIKDKLRKYNVIMTNNTLTLDFEKNSFNEIINIIVKSHCTIVDISIKDISLENLFNKRG